MRNPLKALVDQRKGDTLSEISKLICCALLTLALLSGPACSDRFGAGCLSPSVGGPPQPAPGTIVWGDARTVQFFNCNHDNAGTGLPGRAYNVYTRVDDGAWVPRDGLNPQPSSWTDCHDAAHQGASLTLDLFAIQPGKWEFRLIKLRMNEEPDCDSSAPDVPNACSYLTYIFETVDEAEPAIVDVVD